MARVAVLDSRPPRRVKVVRKGAPAKPLRRAWFEYSLGILGLFLLLAIFVAAKAITPNPPPVIQVESSYNPQTILVDVGQSFDIEEARRMNWEGEFNEANVYAIKFRFSAIDDMPASLPDLFRISFVDSDLIPYTAIQNFQTPNPTRSGPGNTSYEAVEVIHEFTYVVRDAPVGDLYTSASGANRTKFLSETITNLTIPAIGFGQMRIEALEAGDCPTPDTLDFQRFLTCSADNQPDTKAQITFVGYELQIYTPQLTVLGDEE